MKGPAGLPSRVAASATDNWQLLPPIVTGRMPAFKAPAQAGSMKPVGSVSAPLTLPPVAPQEMVAPVQKAPARAMAPPPAPVVPQPVPPQPKPKPKPKAKSERAQANNGNSMPGTNADTSELVKAYEWWSQSDQVQVAAEPAARPAPSDERARQQLPLANEADWTAEPLPGEFTPRGRKQKSAQGPRKMQRRKVFAFLAAGGVAVAGTALFLNFEHIAGMANTQMTGPAAAQKAVNNTDKPATQQQANNAAPANNGQMTMQKAPAANNGQKAAVVNNGTIVGSTKQASNTAVDFTNPTDKKDSFLINLPGNTFVAYERACTHQGVTVNYDPGTKMIVCPAHGAIFDPAKGASVVQGPADQPLPKVSIKVNGDGSITAV
jgi:Rieske Fe-S protein